MRYFNSALIALLAAVNLEAAVVPPSGYGEQTPPVSSDSGRLTAYFFVKSADPFAPRQLWVAFQGPPHEAQLVREYERNASVLFSPDDSFLVVNDECGSDQTDVILLKRSRGARFAPVSRQPSESVWDLFVRSIGLAGRPRLYHMYMQAQAWSADSRLLLISLTGHSDVHNHIDSWYAAVDVRSLRGTFDLRVFNRSAVRLNGCTRRPR